MPNLIINTRIVLDENIFDTDALAYFAQLTTQPSYQRKIKIQTVINELKASGNWTKLDRFWIHANQYQQAGLVSLVNPTSTPITEVNAPAWVQNQGYTSNGSTSYLDSNYDPTINGVNFTQDSCSLGVYNRTNVAENNYEIGTYNAGTTRNCYICSRGTINQCYANLNTNPALGIANSNSLGLIAASRTASTLTTVYRNGASIGTTASVSASVQSVRMFIGALSVDNVASVFSTKQISVSYIGSGAINNASIYTTIQNYMTSINSQV